MPWPESPLSVVTSTHYLLQAYLHELYAWDEWLNKYNTFKEETVLKFECCSFMVTSIFMNY